MEEGSAEWVGRGVSAVVSDGEGRGGRRVAKCRTQAEIKGASPFIDCIKIGLHLQLL